MSAESPYASMVGRVPVRVDDVAVAGARTRCWTYGDDPAAGGPATSAGDNAARTIVALHGLRGDHHGLEPVLAHLTGCRVIVPDLPGFGASEPFPGPHDVDGYAAWARELVAAVAPGATLLGHSFGSVIAAAAAAGLPLARLVLVNPIASPPRRGTRVAATRAAVLLHRLAAVLPERPGTALLRSSAITRVASAAMVTTPDRELRRWIHREHGRYFATFADRRVLLEAFGASVQADVSPYAGGVTAPTLLVAGEHDGIAPPAEQHRLVARFPDARLVVVAGTGHLAHYEAPAEVAVAITGFLA